MLRMVKYINITKIDFFKEKNYRQTNYYYVIKKSYN